MILTAQHQLLIIKSLTMAADCVQISSDCFHKFKQN